MKKKYVISVISLVALLTAVGLFLFRQNALSAPGVNDFTDWQPTAAMIRDKIGTAQKPTPGLSLEQRHAIFENMFRSRFRSQKEMVAVSVKFSEYSNRLTLKCPAIMEPWKMDAAVMMAWRECQTLFGVNYDIDFYKTYLGLGNTIKVGELRTLPESPGIARITRVKAIAQPPNGLEVNNYELIKMNIFFER